MSKDLDRLEIVEKPVEDMTKAELVALVKQQSMASEHQEEMRSQDEKLIESIRSQNVSMQKDQKEVVDRITNKAIKTITHFEQKIDGMSQILEGSLTLLHANEVLNEKEEEK